MLNMQTTELLITTLTFFIAYLVSVTFSGSFRAWVAEKMGDETGAALGFLSLNPFIHIDMLGLMFLFIFFFGWGRYVPINHFNIEDPYRRLKIAAAYFSDTVIHFFSALIGIIVLIVAVGPQMLLFAQQMIRHRNAMSHFFLVQGFPHLPSLTLTLSFIVIAFIYLNVILGVLTLIMNACSVGMIIITDRSNGYQETNQYIMILIPMALIFFFSEPLRIVAIELIAQAGFAMSRAIGLA